MVSSKRHHAFNSIDLWQSTIEGHAIRVRGSDGALCLIFFSCRWYPFQRPLFTDSSLFTLLKMDRSSSIHAWVFCKAFRLLRDYRTTIVGGLCRIVIFSATLRSCLRPRFGSFYRLYSTLTDLTAGLVDAGSGKAMHAKFLDGLSTLLAAMCPRSPLPRG
jgi:hypothetical protein